jgi:quinoprotein glucose dehydrogenase
MKWPVVYSSALTLAATVAMGGTATPTDWSYYNGDPGGTHYSRLDQINTHNVGRLRLAWMYDSRDEIGNGPAQSDFEDNPLVIDGRMLIVTPKGRLICLDAATGNQLWVFDPADGHPVRIKQRLRGVSYWSDKSGARVLFTFREQLIAVDARTGHLIPSFGKGGRVDLRQGLGRDPNSISVANVTPGVVYKDLLILGSTGATPGHLRAFDVRSGRIRWTFHTIPYPGEFGYDTWPKDAWKTAFGANDWAGLTLDSERGIVFAPLGSGGMLAKDFYGADRKGDNLFGTSLVALNAATGKRLWHFQFVKHDLWDRDPPTQPTLVNVRRDGKIIPAIAQPTKAGLLYVFNRVTGESLFPLEERAVPLSDVPGEVSAPTQTFPLAPEPFARQHLTADLLSTRTPDAAHEARELLAARRSRGPFDPPSLQGTVIFPGLDGGAEYGGAAYDPDTGLLYINANEMAWTLKLRPAPPATADTSGRAIYLNHCAACHGAEMQGSPPEFPPLVGVGARLPYMEILYQVMMGGGRMPGFGQLGQEAVASVVDYIQTGRDTLTRSTGTAKPAERAKFVFDGYNRLLDKEGYPAIAPPWGTLNAIDVSTGQYAWKIPFGEYPELAAQGLNNTGSENYGGAVVTAGGLLFIGATVYDNKMHAYDKLTGKLLWEVELPNAGLATPATYMVNGRQFVAIAAGGGKNPKGKPAGKVVAFALNQ